MPRVDPESSERTLVRAAAVDKDAREQLRQALTPYVQRAMERLIETRGISKSRKSEFVAVGMKPFDAVFSVYLKNAHNLDDEEGHFYKYYVWWARQEAVAYLASNS